MYELGHPTLFSRPDRVNKPLYVVTTLFNAVRWRSRWKLFEDFCKMVECGGGTLYFAEAAFHERDFVFAEPNNPRHLRLIIHDELWVKENMQNLVLQTLPKDYEYVLLADADIQFVRHDWADEIRQQLQHYPVIQPWSEAHDLGPNHEIIRTFKSFIWSWRHHQRSPQGKESYYYIPPDAEQNFASWHPGYAWAYRRDAIETLGNFVDWSILGSADKLMAYALIQQPFPPSYDLGPNGNRWLTYWAQRAAKLNKNIGYMDGALLHAWHGPKVSRQYGTRNAMLTVNGFDPELDLYRDWQGLYRLTERSPELRDTLRLYFRQRNEDSTEL